MPLLKVDSVINKNQIVAIAQNKHACALDIMTSSFTVTEMRP